MRNHRQRMKNIENKRTGKNVKKTKHNSNLVAIDSGTKINSPHWFSNCRVVNVPS